MSNAASSGRRIVRDGEDAPSADVVREARRKAMSFVVDRRDDARYLWRPCREKPLTSPRTLV